MKKLVLTTLIAVSLISSAFAVPVKMVSSYIKSSFEAAFPNATEVNWKVTEDYAKASFTSDNVRTEAFYDHKGNFAGSSHAITIDQLPVNVKRSFAKKYGSYTVNEAIQFDDAEETAYYISARNEKESVVLKVLNGTISIFKANGK